MKASEVKRSPWSFRPRTLVKPILLPALPGGLALGMLLAAYHPVMVWANGGEWRASFDATGKLRAVKCGKVCRTTR